MNGKTWENAWGWELEIGMLPIEPPAAAISIGQPGEAKGSFLIYDAETLGEVAKHLEALRERFREGGAR